MTLRNTEWGHVNVQVVITRAGSCSDSDSGPDIVSSESFVMHKDETKSFIALGGTSICWRHDRFPNKPQPGEWTGWTHAVPFPGEDTTTDL